MLDSAFQIILWLAMQLITMSISETLVYVTRCFQLLSIH